MKKEVEQIPHLLDSAKEIAQMHGLSLESVLHAVENEYALTAQHHIHLLVLPVMMEEGNTCARCECTERQFHGGSSQNVFYECLALE